ncbi:hypothetical protein [Polaromonas sp.]|uniref:hypothetical protein n=1 Tax=Polaromonas sp. TaxID=1869339 RepID=UPI0013B9BCB9|nr:hypothetical protein [Polaromonas sp.]NDP61071.1 hypothetical protein [Polaromonas sp.]
MSAPKRKAVGGYHTTTTAIKIHTANVAPGQKKRYTALKRCATFLASPELLGPVLNNTVIDSGAFTHALSCVFSRPNTLVYGRDGLVRKAGRMAESMLLTSRPPYALNNANGGFLSHSGAEAMTSVNTPTTSTLDTIARQQAIENALTTALYFIRLPGTPSALHAATGRANRALSMLKQACSEAKIGGAA